MTPRTISYICLAVAVRCAGFLVHLQMPNPRPNPHGVPQGRPGNKPGRGTRPFSLSGVIVRAVSALTHRLVFAALPKDRLLHRLYEGEPRFDAFAALWLLCATELEALTDLLKEVLRQPPSDQGRLWSPWLEAPCSAQLLSAMQAMQDGAAYQLNPSVPNSDTMRSCACRALTAVFGAMTLVAILCRSAWSTPWPGACQHVGQGGASV